MYEDVITDREYTTIQLLLKNLAKSDTSKVLAHRATRLNAVIQFLFESNRITGETMKLYYDKIDKATKCAKIHISQKREKY